jgi:5-methyltetrahydrofolate--homocysteine methyltransferase
LPHCDYPAIRVLLQAFYYMNSLLADIASKRILILDGAMGTMIQRHHLTEADFRNHALENHPHALKGNNDLLCITRPDIIRTIHSQYLEAGADIIETNTFGGTSIAQADYHLEALVYEINFQGAKIAREVADEFTRREPSKPRFVAGSIGPTTKLASMSPEVGNPGFRAINFAQLRIAFGEQIRGLMEGGADLLLIETITDTLNAKAALFAAMEVFEEKGRELPIMISGTITDASGRILSGQTAEAFLISIAHIPLFSVGFNCALGASALRPYLQILADQADCLVSAHPNAGLPNEFGQYDQTPEEMADQIEEYLKLGLVNIIGGCCGSTPEHIRQIAQKTTQYTARKIQAEAAIL